MRAMKCAFAAGLLLPVALYQSSCVVLVPDVPGAVIVDTDQIPHFDGDGEDSFLDRIFGFDDDDDDDHDHGWWGDDDDDWDD